MESVTLYQKVSNAEMRLDYCEYCGSTPDIMKPTILKLKDRAGRR